MVSRLNALLRRIPLWVVWILGLLPLAFLLRDTLAGNLGVDPIPRIEHRLGRTAFYFLVGGLGISPFLWLSGVSLIRFRRAVGLIAFLYICLHIAAWVVLDMGLTWNQMARDVLRRPYLTVGMAAFALLLPLAVTSNAASIRALGARAWKNLHRLVYLAVPLAGLHYLWVGKLAEPQPLSWLAIILLLLCLRLFRRRRG
ncbi:ferric reductase-like transmembrane domain-containing protein [uncultured Paracoccus sp.]|uniref:sulfite oxidase heme-binding subunit YedZ n=1 Tax=uncultured Paracoccus sp. TaxID=189685 RepID=UPI0025CCF6DA|nr:ferric reductase-like transmembrane domain-containing protein [uncultured Paracoccus sp.]